MNKYAVKCEWMAVSDYTEELTLYDLPEANNYSATLNKKFSDTAMQVILKQDSK